jgi:hypothetical protein
MFREDKSIGGPVEFPSPLSHRLKPQFLAIGYCKTLPAKAVTGGFAPFEIGQKRLKGLPRNIARSRFVKQPAMQRPAKHRPGLFRQDRQIQFPSSGKGIQFVEPPFQRRIVLLQQPPRARRAGDRITL